MIKAKDDAISRADAINIVRKLAVDEQDGSEYWRSKVNEYLCTVYEEMTQLPSVQPSRKGHWIKTPLLTCDRCNKINKSGIESDFCPNCGADMRGVELE